MAGIDWQAFSAAFMKDTAANINEKKDAAKTWEETQQALALKNVGTAQKRQQLVDRANGYFQYLKDNGASNDQIQAALDTGADGIVKFAEKVASAVADRGGRKLTSADTSTIISLPDTFRPAQMDDSAMKDYIAKVYGMGGVSKGVGDSANVSLWDRMTGRGAKDMARARLDQNVMYDGYTALDLNELAQTSEYNNLNPGTMATFLDYKYATPDVVYKANSQVDAMITDMRQSDPYKAAVKELEAVRRKEVSAIGKAYSQEQYEAELKAASDKLIEMHRSAAGAVAKQYMDTYGSSMQDALGTSWSNLFGADFFDMQAEEPTVAPIVGGPIVGGPIVGGPTVAGPLTETVDATKVGNAMNLAGMNAEIIPTEGGTQTLSFDSPTVGPMQISVDADGKVLTAATKDGTPIRADVAQRIWDEFSIEATAKEAQLAEVPVVGEPVAIEPTKYDDPIIQQGMDIKAAELANPTNDAYFIKIKGRMPLYYTTSANLALIPDGAIENGNASIMPFTSENKSQKKYQSITSGELKAIFKERPEEKPLYVPAEEPKGLMTKPVDKTKDYVDAEGNMVEGMSGADVQRTVYQEKFGKDIVSYFKKWRNGKGPMDALDATLALNKWVRDSGKGVLPGSDKSVDKLVEDLYAQYLAEKEGN